jgi:hypothetical protein
MHFDVPERLAHSAREFLGHYLMIVISILSALAAEQAVDYAYNVHKAHVFQVQVEVDLKRAREMVASAIQDNHRTVEAWLELLRRARALDGSCTPANEPVYRGILKDAVLGFRENTPIFPVSAWESAVSTGAVVYMGPQEVHRYSNAYVMQRFYATAMANALQGGIGTMSELSSRLSERQMDCGAVARLVNLRVRMLSVAQSNLEELRDELAK